MKKIDKKHIQGFIAGILVMTIVTTGVVTGIYPEFFTGTFTRQIGNTTYPTEVDLQEIACEPTSIKAKTEYEQKIIINIEKDKISSKDTKHYVPSGLFEGMKVEKVKFEKDKLAITLKGKVEQNHAYGSDIENPNGIIYIMPEALKDKNTAYSATVIIEYPEIVPEKELLEDKVEYNETLKFTLNGDKFIKVPTKEDITLLGGFEGMTVNTISQNDQQLTIDITGQKSTAGGNGIVKLSSSVLESGFSVDRVIKIAGTPQLVVYSSITTEEPFDETIHIGISNDFFAEELTPDMFSFTGTLKDCVITAVEKGDDNQSIKLTIKGEALRSPGQSEITISNNGTETKRTASGIVNVINPKINVFHITDPKTQQYEIYSLGNDFEQYISAKDFELKGALAGLTIEKVEWHSGYYVQVTIAGEPAEGEGIISIRSAAMGGITGAEATVIETDYMGLLDMTETSDMDGQTGTWGMDKIVDWGIDKVKSLIIEGIKSGLQAGAKKGFMYALREAGLEGPPIEDMLGEIQGSINELSAKVTTMYNQMSTQLDEVGLQGRLSDLVVAQVKINYAHNYFNNLITAIDEYKTANPKKPLSTELQNDLDEFCKAGGIGDVHNEVLTIANSLTGIDNLASLITKFDVFFRKVYPFEHNSIQQLMSFVANMNMYISKGTLIYADYCNYRGNNIALKTFNEEVDASLDLQKTKLPTGYELNIRKVWGSNSSSDIAVKCNKDGRTYIIVGSSFEMNKIVKKGDYSYFPFNSILYRIFTNRNAQNTHRTINQSELNNLLSCWDTFHKSSGISYYDFLLKYTADNGMPNWGWLYLDYSGILNVWFTLVVNITFYDMGDDVYRTYNSWDLYDNYADKQAKVIITAR